MLSSFFFLFKADSCLEYERYNRTKYFRTDNSCACNTISYCTSSRQGKCLEAEKKKELPKLYSTNKKVYKKFLEYVKESGHTFFDSQTNLYIALEKIKRVSTTVEVIPP